MQYSYCKLVIGCLVLQVAVDATVYVLVPGYGLYGPSTTRVAAFSNRDATIIDSSIKGQLEYAAPYADACSPIAHPFFVKTNEQRNIVLINGADKCDFITKIKNARAAGFEAAILFDPFPTEHFNYSDITFPVERTEINMTVVLVAFEDGIKLQNYLFPESRKANLFVVIEPTSNIELYVLIGLGFVFGVPVIVLLVLILILVVQNKLENYRSNVQSTVNVANRSNIHVPVSGVSESAHLLAFESSAPDNCLSSTEKLKNEFEEALGSVGDVQGSELKRKNTKAVIV